MSTNRFDLLIDLSDDDSQSTQATPQKPAVQVSKTADPLPLRQTQPPTFLRQRIPNSAAPAEYILPCRAKPRQTYPFSTDPETRGREAFRKHEEPQRNFRLPINFNPLESTGRPKNASNRVTSFPALEQISDVTDAHLVQRRSGGHDQILL